MPASASGPAAASRSISPRAATSARVSSSARCTARSANRLSAAVTRSSGHRPARSASPVSSASRRRLWRRIAISRARRSPISAAEGLDQTLEGRVRAVEQQRAQDLGLGEQRLAEEGAVAEHRCEQTLRIDRARARIDPAQRLGQAGPAREAALGRCGIADPRQSVRRAWGWRHDKPVLRRSIAYYRTIAIVPERPAWS